MDMPDLLNKRDHEVQASIHDSVEFAECLNDVGFLLGDHLDGEVF